MLMQIKNSQIEPMVAAILRLDEPVSYEEKNGAKYHKRLSFDGRVRYNLGKNLRILKGELESLVELRGKFIREAMAKHHHDPESDKLLGEAQKDFIAQWKPVADATVELNLLPVELSSINLKDNPIPIESLGALLDTIFTGEPKE
jgi:hypothetical protein